MQHSVPYNCISNSICIILELVISPTIISDIITPDGSIRLPIFIKMLFPYRLIREIRCSSIQLRWCCIQASVCQPPNSKTTEKQISFPAMHFIKCKIHLNSRLIHTHQTIKAGKYNLPALESIPTLTTHS